MANFAKAEFALTVCGEDGYSQKDHLLNAWKQSGIKPQELVDAPPCPPLALQLWGYFARLHKCRPNNGFGVSSLLHSEVMAWCHLYKINLDPWELDAIFDLDTLYIASRAKPKGK